MQCAPDFGFVGPPHLDDHQLVGIGQRFVHFYTQHTGDAALVAQVYQHLRRANSEKLERARTCESLSLFLFLACYDTLS